MSQGSPFLTIRETAQMLGVSVMTVRRLMDRGELSRVQLMRRSRIQVPRAEVLELIASRTTKNKKE